MIPKNENCSVSGFLVIIRSSLVLNLSKTTISLGFTIIHSLPNFSIFVRIRNIIQTGIILEDNVSVALVVLPHFLRSDEIVGT